MLLALLLSRIPQLLVRGVTAFVRGCIAVGIHVFESEYQNTDGAVKSGAGVNTSSSPMHRLLTHGRRQPSFQLRPSIHIDALRQSVLGQSTLHQNAMQNAALQASAIGHIAGQRT
jgi:hypothetical protein